MVHFLMEKNVSPDQAPFILVMGDSRWMKSSSHIKTA